jgi:hypothetical protein
MEARTIGQAYQSNRQTLAVTTDQHSTGGLSQSATLTPAHNGSIVCASHGQATVTLRNVVQAYCSTGVLIALVVLAYWSTGALARLVAQAYCNTGVLAYRRTIRGDYVTDKPGLWYRRTVVQEHHSTGVLYDWQHTTAA